MSREFPPRHAQTAEDSGFTVLFNAETTMAFQAALLSSGRIIPSVTIVESNSIYPSIVGSFRPYHGQISASTHARAALHHCSAEEAGLRVRFW